MLLVIKLPKLRVVVFRNTFCLNFNIHAFTRSSIYKGVVLRFIIARKFTSLRFGLVSAGQLEEATRTFRFPDLA